MDRKTCIVIRSLPVLLLVLFSQGLARQAVVGRDGALIFQEPAGDSVVLDILAMGTGLEVVGHSGLWCKVALPGSSRSGFIRRAALKGTRSEAVVMKGGGEGGEGLKHDPASIQGRLDRIEAKLRKARRMLDDLEQIIELIFQRLDESGHELTLSTGSGG
ncbi:MAG: hypothetical protein U9N45_01450 [Gemmatimonadota bacterium]|nr:hypothetical protein [Gemmatimonadota bacterium]